MFDWDAENIRHVGEHGISREEVEQVIQNDPLDLELQFRNDEERMASLGRTDTGRLLVVVTTWRGEEIRVVTAFPAPKRLRDLFYAQRGRT